MSSASSTDRTGPDPNSGFQAWHFYMLLSMAGATAAVIVSRDPHPAALLLISAAAIAVGLAATALHYALMGFLETESLPKPVTARTREFLEQEKALVLRSIKELEFDRAMRKVGDKDFAEIGGRLRARAMEIMKDLESGPQSVVRGPESAVPGSESEVRARARRTRNQERTTDDEPRTTDDRPRTTNESACASCETLNDPDARFCKQCGAKL